MLAVLDEDFSAIVSCTAGAQHGTVTGTPTYTVYDASGNLVASGNCSSIAGVKYRVNLGTLSSPTYGRGAYFVTATYVISGNTYSKDLLLRIV